MKQDKKRMGRPISTAAPWGELYKFVGGQQKLAEKLGVSKSTVGKWAADVHRVPEMVRKELLRLCKHHGIEEGMAEFQPEAQKKLALGTELKS